MDGDVITRSAISVTESFGATTINGDIEADFKAAPRTLDATTDNGDVRIGLPPPGPYVVNANTGQESERRWFASRRRRTGPAPLR